MLLLPHPTQAAKKKTFKRQNTKQVVFQDDQCFCGIRYDKTKKLNLDLFGSKVGGQIINYVDQSISKFNAINMASELALPSLKQTTKDHYFGKNDSTWTEYQNMNKKFNGENLESLRITLLKSIHFSFDENKNKVMTLEFMMGRKVAFKIEIKLYDHSKKQFNIQFTQLAYFPGDPEKTNEMRRKGTVGLMLSRSLSHFDKNQLEVDVCRMMYTALNQLCLREFNTSISSQIVRYGTTKMTANIGKGCKREVYFRQRFSNEYMGNLVQTFYSKIKKKNYALRAKLVVEKKEDFHAVNQEFENSTEELTRQISKSKIESFDDESEMMSQTSSMSKDSGSNQLEINLKEETSNNSAVEIRESKQSRSSQKTSELDIDVDSSSTSSPSHKSKTSIIETKEYYHLRNRDVPKTTNDKENPSPSHKSNSSLTETKEYYHLRNRDVPKTKKDKENIDHKSEKSHTEYIIQEMETSNHTHSVNSSHSNEQDLVTEIESTSNKSGNNMREILKAKFQKMLEKHGKDMRTNDDSQTKVVIDSEKKKKRKRVVVLMEITECKLCLNDIKKEIFVKLLNNKSYII